jgi:5-methyltetrahydropteroyltriglutamate--homocysteine methyltransferase
MEHPYEAKVAFDGGDLDCGSGLLLLIRKNIDPLAPGELLEIRSTEISVSEELPAWCRLTKNDLVSHVSDGKRHSFLVCKGPFAGAPKSALPAAAPFAPDAQRPAAARAKLGAPSVAEAPIPTELPKPAPAPPIEPFSVMGIGSFPRPRWMLRALHDHLERRLSDKDFEEASNDAVRLAVDAQLRAGVDVVTDGEQRRDNYASFVGALLDNCQLIPITDLLPYVDDPQEFARELKALDVPAELVRHPAVFGNLRRSRPLAVHEVEYVRTRCRLPVKVALPGPYLLTRTMWMECITDRAYETRDQLAGDVVRVLKEEAHALLAAGAAIVQLDEPVLSEVVFGQSSAQRSFMCGALSARLDRDEELAFAEALINRVVSDLPRDRVALHICRGNWTADEQVALRGDYAPLVPLLSAVKVGTLFLELCTPRAGDASVLRTLPKEVRVGVGVANQKTTRIESPEEIVASAEKAVAVLGPERILLNPDCGFATFADNPVAASDVAEQKLASIARARELLRARHCR